MAAARVCTQAHVHTRTHATLRTRIMALRAHNCMNAVFNMSLPVGAWVRACVRGWVRACVRACVLECVRA